jgi:hypothetical protein
MTVCWSAPTFLRFVRGTQSSLGQVLAHMICARCLFTDETLVAPLASFVHNMLETSGDVNTMALPRHSHDLATTKMPHPIAVPGRKAFAAGM